MPVTWTHARYTDKTAPRAGVDGICYEYFEHTVSTLATGDTIYLLAMKTGMRIIDAVLGVNGAVGSGAGNLKLGDDGDDDRYILVKDLTAAAVHRLDNSVGLGYKLTQDRPLLITAGTITTVVGATVIRVMLRYSWN